MTKRKKMSLGIVILLIFLIVIFSKEIENGLTCLAYYEQCSANRLEGFTKEQCLNRDDAVAFLLTTNICLVKSSK